MATLKIKDWEKFQHFKNRRPPWIKLYRDLLDDKDWHDLSPANAKILIMLWLLASESHNGTLPSLSKIAFRLRASEKAIESAISELGHWLISSCHHVDITTISTQHHDGSPETEYSELETKGELSEQSDTAISPLDLLSLEEIRDRWNAIPGVKPCKQITGVLATRMNTLRKEHTRPWWEALFLTITLSPFLSGKVPPTDGHPQWLTRLDWATGPINLSKILAGNYDDTVKLKPKPKVAI
jgi:hypothetical protein